VTSSSTLVTLVAPHVLASTAMVSASFGFGPKDPFAKVHMLFWHPERMRLGFQAGTLEPFAGAASGVIPEADQKGLRAVFNGGFRDVHGGFGVWADGKPLRPLKPYAATVSIHLDGRASFGTWAPDQTVADGVVAARQNLTPLLEGKAIDPYQRRVWGGPPSGHETKLVRSGLCVRADGIAGYFYGIAVNPEMLGQAMVDAGCTYGIHLDMNDGMAGADLLEPVAAGAAEIAPSKLVKQAGSTWRVTRLVKEMGHAGSPWVARPNPRDFFYLVETEPVPGRRNTYEPGPTPPAVSVWRAAMR
jgi:hypothetical protein